MNNNISSECVNKRVVIINELVKGQESATKLKNLLQNEKKNPFGDGSLSSYKLAANVLRSFTQALSIISQPAAGGCGDRLPSSGIKKSSMSAKGGRGCYKRRKNEERWSTVSPTIDDNHSWRKYGQKEIMNYKFPRNYFRCAFKHDQGCSATKQVQKTQNNPDMYQITYIGIHTCKTTPNDEMKV